MTVPTGIYRVLFPVKEKQSQCFLLGTLECLGKQNPVPHGDIFWLSIALHPQLKTMYIVKILLYSIYIVHSQILKMIWILLWIGIWDIHWVKVNIWEEKYILYFWLLTVKYVQIIINSWAFSHNFNTQSMFFFVLLSLVFKNTSWCLIKFQPAVAQGSWWGLLAFRNFEVWSDVIVFSKGNWESDTKVIRASLK